MAKHTTSKKQLLNKLRDKETGKIKELIEAEEKLRSDLASELHDNIGQLLISSQLILELELSKNETADSNIPHVIEILKEAFIAVRDVTHGLSTSYVKDIGLSQALKYLVKTINLSDKLKLTLQFHKERELKNISPDLSLSIYRIVQEHLTNILKHSNAEKVIISVYVTAHTLDVEIKDDGKGFDKNKIKKGIGLKNIYDRTSIHHGVAYIASTPGEGCVLSICIPLNSLP